MATRFTLKLRGAKEFQAALGRLSPAKNPVVMRRALGEIGDLGAETTRDEYLQGGGRSRLQRQTGELRDSIEVDKSGLPKKVRWGTPIFPWPEFHENGLGRWPKRPFIKPALREAMKRAEAIVLHHWKRNVQGGGASIVGGLRGSR